MISSIFTHFLAAMLGGTFGVVAMALLMVGKDDEEREPSKCAGCPQEHDIDCQASYTYCWKDMNGGTAE